MLRGTGLCVWITCEAAGCAGFLEKDACPWRPGASGEPAVQLLGEVLVTLGNDTRDEQGQLRRLGPSHSWSSLFFSSLLPTPKKLCFCTICTPLVFMASGCPALVSSFPSGGKDIVPPSF
jgi:hypothetical protein